VKRLSRQFLVFALSTVFWILLDQLTKYLAVRYLKGELPIPVVNGFWDLCYVENRGAAWGMMQGQQLFLRLFSIAAIVWVFWNLRKLFFRLWGGAFIASLLVSGIVGNLIDRIFRNGGVVDFLDFHWGSSHFPAFNIADSCICVGFFLVLITQWRLKPKNARTEDLCVQDGSHEERAD